MFNGPNRIHDVILEDLVIRVLEDQAQLAAGVPVGREVGHAARADRVAGKLDVSLVGGQKPADDGGQR